MSFKINSNISKLKESSTLWINQKAIELRKNGKEVYHFGFGQSPFPVHSSIENELKKNSFQKDYLPTKGLLKLRQNISSYYQENYNYNFNPDNIFIGPGSKELIFQVLYLLEGQVLIPAPSWVSYGPQVNIKGKKPTIILTDKINNYKLQPNELENVCRNLENDQKILIINSPNNPTGAVYTDHEIEELVVVCKKYNIVIISDEIYGQVDFSKSPKKGFHHYYPTHTIISSGISKAQSAGGYRLGFIYLPEGNKEIINAMNAIVSETFSAVSTPIQYAAVKAFDKENKSLFEYIERCTNIHNVCGHYIYARLKNMKIESSVPEGAFYLFVDFSKHQKYLTSKNIKNSEDLCKVLLNETGIALLPGSDFYYPKEILTARLATVDYDGEVLLTKSIAEEVNYSFIEKYALNLKNGMDKLESWLNQ